MANGLRASCMAWGYSQFLADNPEAAEAHQLLSMVQECLLNYPGARISLEASLRISGQRSSKDLKRLALLREYEGKWEELLVTPEELANLGKFLERALAEAPCDHSPKHTRMWLAEHSPSKIDSKLKAFRHWGGYCDCEVLNNVV